MRKTVVIGLVVLALAGLVFSYAVAQEKAAPAPTPKPAIGDLSLLNFNTQKMVALDSSKPIMLIFMNVSCAACREELRAVADKYDEISKKVTVYGVSEDFDPDKALPKYLETFKYPFDFVVDKKFQAGRLLGFSYTPATVILKKGEVVFKKSGYDGNLQDVLDAVKKL